MKTTYIKNKRYTRNLTKMQRSLLKELNEGSLTLETLKMKYSMRTISTLVQRQMLEINLQPSVGLK